MRRYLLVGCAVSVLALCLSSAGTPSVKGDSPIFVGTKIGTVPAPAKTKPVKPAAGKVEKKTIVVAMAIEGEYAEGPTAPGVFGDVKPSLAKLIERLDAAAADKNVVAVWLKIDDLGSAAHASMNSARRLPGCGRRTSRSMPS
jgi:hypothetical protein